MNRFFHRYRKAIVWVVAVGFALSIFGMGMLQRFSPAEPGAAEETVLMAAGHEVNRMEMAQRTENLLTYYTQLYQMYGMDFTQQLRGADGAFLMQQLNAQAAEDMVRTVLLDREARRLGVSVSTAEVEQAVAERYQQLLGQVDGDEAILEQYLAAEGMTLEQYKSDLRSSEQQRLREEGLRRAVVGVVEPTDETLEEYFAEHEARYEEEPERVRIAHIMVRDAALADELLAKVGEEDADWSALADEYSLHEETRDAGGESDWFTMGESGISSRVESVAFDLQEGGITLVTDGEDQHIIKLMERRGPVIPNLADVREDVLEDYIREETEDRWNAWYSDLRSAADVDVRDPLLEAFMLFDEDKEGGLRVLEHAFEAGEVRDVNARFYLGRMHEALKNDATAEQRELEELEERTAGQEDQLEVARRQAEEHREAALESYLAFVEAGEVGETVLDRILRLDPDNAVARYRLAEVYRERGEYAEAEEQYELALKVDPELVVALVGRGDVAMSLMLYGRAVEYYGRALERQPDSLSLQVKLAEAQFKDGDHAKARELLETVLGEDERNLTAMMLMGDLLMEQGDPEGALERYQEVYRRNPTSEVQLKRARALAAVGELDDAERAFRTLVRQFPYRAEGYIALGDLYLEQGDEDRAEEQYRLALRQAPDVATRETVARKIVGLEPDDIDMRFRLASFLRDQYKYDAAIAQYEAILERSPDNIHAFLGLGDSHVPKTQYDKALEYYDKALDVAETRAERVAVYGKIVACEERRAGRDRPLTEAGLEALWQRALLRQEAGQLNEAREDLQRIYDTDEDFRSDEVLPLLEELGGQIVVPPAEELEELEEEVEDPDPEIDLPDIPFEE